MSATKNQKTPYRRSMIKERVNPSDFNNLNIQYNCEQCVYFMDKESVCNLGFIIKNHTKEEQDLSYNMSGHMKFCRFLEID